MTTRFYLPASGTAAVSPTPSTSWTVSTGATFLPAVTAKSNTALANGTARVTAVSGAIRDVCDTVFVSDTIAAQTIAVGTFSAVIKTIESTSTANGWLQIFIRVISGDGTVERGVIYAGSTSTTTGVTTAGAENQEYPITTAATRIKNAIATTAVTSLAGDRICIELGSRYNSAATNSTFTLKYGDPSATADYALTAALTTDLCPWVELSQTLTFGGGAPSVTQQLYVPNRAAIRRASTW